VGAANTTIGGSEARWIGELAPHHVRRGGIGDGRITEVAKQATFDPEDRGRSVVL